MPYCPECRGEYREGYTYCKECGVDLVEELPEESEEESQQELLARERRMPQIFASLADRTESVGSIKALCWILVVISLFYFLFNFSFSVYTTLSFYTLEYGYHLLYVVLFFSVIPFTDSFLITALILSLAASLLASRRSALLRILFYIALICAILFSSGLTALIVDTIRYYDRLNLSSTVIFIISMAIYVLIAMAAAFFARGSRHSGKIGVVQNERG